MTRRPRRADIERVQATAVDATYRADLRELNDLNFARFDAMLDAKLAELKSELLKWMFLFWATTGIALGGLFLQR